MPLDLPVEKFLECLCENDKLFLRLPKFMPNVKYDDTVTVNIYDL